MKQYEFAIEPTNMEVSVVAKSEQQARQVLWAEMPDSLKNICACIELLDESCALDEQKYGVQGNPFSRILKGE